MRPSWDETWMELAVTIGRRSLCSRDQVGAVVVSASNRIIDTGYNGPPAGFHNITEGREWKTGTCEQWCPRATYHRVAAENDAYIHKMLSDPDLRIVPGVDRNIQMLSLDYSDCPSIHAEANALLFSDRTQREGGTIYVSSGTCSGCAKLVANSGLVRAVYAASTRTDLAAHRDSSRWYDFMRDCGLRVDVM